MMNTAAERPVTAYNPIFEGFTNEAIYAALSAATAPLDAGLEELQRRLRPIIINASKAFLLALSWTFDDAMGEALIHLWELVRKHSYKNDGAPFDRFFAATWANRLNGFFQKTVMRNPVTKGNVQIGWCDHEPVFVSSCEFHEKAEHYREQQAERSRRYYDRKLAKEGKTRRPKKPKMTDEERREKNRLRIAAKRAALTPDERAAMNAAQNERRKESRRKETKEEKEARLQKRRAYEKARLVFA